FDERQVIRYLEQYESQILRHSDGQMDSAKLRQIIKDTYDLDDLARRPILLKLIVSTIPKVPHVSGQYSVPFAERTLKLSQITPSVLYHLYTENELRREEEERGSDRRLIGRAKKSELISALAYEMLGRGVLALETEDFQEVVRRQLSLNLSDTEAYAS